MFLFRTVAALLAAVLLLPCEAFASSARSHILMDGQTGRVLLENNADEKSLIASTTKIMTALVVCERCNVLDRMKIPAQAVGIEGSSMYLKKGEVLTVQELLYGLMLHSGNDAAVALAIYCGGTAEGFVEMMNDKARLLGLKSTHFANPNGLDHPQHYSTARDLARLTAYAMENPIFRQTVSARTVTAGGRHLRNHNRLLWLLEGADGVKTGFTRASGRILVSSAQRQGRRLIAVTIKDPNDWQDHIEMIENGFSGYRMCQILAQNQQVGIREVIGGSDKQVPVIAGEDFYYPLRKDEKPELVLSGLDFLYAPVVCGSSAGQIYICIDGKSVGSAEVFYGKTIEMQAEDKPGFWERWFGGVLK